MTRSNLHAYRLLPAPNDWRRKTLGQATLIQNNELVEVIRIRERYLDAHERKRQARKGAAA